MSRSGESEAILASLQRVVRAEGEAVLALATTMGESYVEAVRWMHECEGRVLVSGLGKSGIVARKIAATLTGTGTPALWLARPDGTGSRLVVAWPEAEIRTLFWAPDSRQPSMMLAWLRSSLRIRSPRPPARPHRIGSTGRSWAMAATASRPRRSGSS